MRSINGRDETVACLSNAFNFMLDYPRSVTIFLVLQVVNLETYLSHEEKER